ncbi:MAG: protein-(glutamine-N5) methyltransferase, release factor-specific [Arachnia propionica]|nr:MAG: protein-(glutamine-N5) methyltransferase, release factor-specific [Arachnia propionica]
MSATRQLLSEATKRLRLIGAASPDVDARQLLAHALGCTTARLPLITEVAPAQEAQFKTLVQRRAAGTPVQHLTRSVGFRYNTLRVGPGVFVPRPETELLVEPVLGFLRHNCDAVPLVVELCAGSGALSLAVATEARDVSIIAVEKSADAFAYLSHNVAGHPIQLVLADIAEALPELSGKADVVMANPPYLPLTEAAQLPAEVLAGDPAEALFGGEDGLDAVRVVAQTSARLLRPGGLVVCEHHEDHGAAVREIFQASGFEEAATHRDLTGRDRFVTALAPHGRIKP